MTSIRRYLNVTLALGLALASLLIVFATYAITHHKMEEILDVQLSLQGRIVSSLIGPDTPREEYVSLARHLDQPGHPARWYGDAFGVDGSDPEPMARRYHPGERLLTLGFWQADGTPWLMGAEWNDAGPFPAPWEEGYRWQEYAGERWRVFSLRLDDGERWLSIGLRESFHDALSREAVLGYALPILVALPLLLLLVGVVVRRGLRPLASLSKQVKGRDARDLRHLDTDVPRELKPLRDALNDFIARLDDTLERERRFTADAAHELRNPLAALKIHLDNALAGEPDSLRKAQGGIERLQRVVEQLLTLASLDRQEVAPTESLDLQALVQELTAEHWPLAEARHQMLEVSGLSRHRVEANAIELGILLRNLLDNALRHTPVGGTIEVASGEEPEGVWLAVRDTGPGIPEALLGTVTERFWRNADQSVGGSGLGLAIAAELARRQRIHLDLSNRPGGGLESRIRFTSRRGDPRA